MGNLIKRWRDTEPVRLYLYGLSVPVLGLLIAYGWLTGTEAAAWGAVLLAALVPGAEAARASVDSPATARARGGAGRRRAPGA